MALRFKEEEGVGVAVELVVAGEFTSFDGDVSVVWTEESTYEALRLGGEEDFRDGAAYISP